MSAALIATIAEVRRRLGELRRAGKTIGFVPTMGALHAGHTALIGRARIETDHVCVSIFVNGPQFDRRDDYLAYGIDLAHDVTLCEAHGVDTIFTPAEQEMYAAAPSTAVEVAGVSERLCGKFRPGHFRAVATVVAKLFHIVGPDRAYFGRKDAQQLAVIERMVRDLNFPVEIVPVPTVREADGVALSSRNQRLSAEERRVAPVLFEALRLGQEMVSRGAASARDIRQAILHRLHEATPMRVEYVEVVDPANMIPIENVSGPVLIAAAVWLGQTRLIDNVSCETPAL
ncbi:MAG TPA: pantoate--beta-alanine ligase [Bryobacteraceae bacterium]|nr:pantoate--beta-alanine ligase [Bryobacteraceae bacterium]